MLKLILDLILTFGVLSAVAIVCAASGRVALRVLGISIEQPINCNTLWLGFSVVITLINIVHLFIPIDWQTGAFFFLVALITFYSSNERTKIAGLLISIYQYGKHRYVEATLLAIIAVIWSLRSMGIPNNFDSGLYHFASIRWMNEYPIIPGLGNLHWRLALNQSYFGYLSLLNIYPFWNKGYAAGGLFIIYLTVATLLEVGKTQRESWRWLIGGTLFIFCGYLAGTLPNPSPDTAIGIIEIAIFVLLFRIIKNHQFKSSDNLQDLIVVIVLSLTLITVKLSSIAFATTCIILVLRLQFVNVIYYRKVFFKVVILMLLMISIYVLRGYLLSGAPLFPSMFAGAWYLDWAVLPEVVNFEVNLIYSWGRQPGEVLPDQALGRWGWISDWLQTVPLLDRIIFLLSSLLMLMTLALNSFNKTLNKNRQYLMLYLPIATAFAFWFVTAPDVRFLGAVPTQYLGLSLWLFYISLKQYSPAIAGIFFKRNQVMFWIIVVSIVLISLKMTGLRSLSFHGWTKIPEHPVEVHKTLTNLHINVPLIDGQCWNAPLPCASVFNGNLHADPLNLPWPLSFLNVDRFFYSVKFLNLSK